MRYSNRKPHHLKTHTHQNAKCIEEKTEYWINETGF